MKTLGLIAGSGMFPLILARQASLAKFRVVAFAVRGEAAPDIKNIVDELYWLYIYEIDRLLEMLAAKQIREVVMAGKINKALLFKNAPALLKQMPLKNIWNAVKDRRDDSLLLAVADRLRQRGIRLMDSTSFMKPFFADKKVMTDRAPTDRENEDIKFGFEAAKRIAGMDVGQSVTVKDKAIMAVEAIEGTDDALQRGNNLCGGNAVLVKVSKIRQDMRFDVPVVGAQTLDAMHACGCRVMAVEAGKTLMLEKEAFIEKANEYGICVIGV